MLPGPKGEKGARGRDGVNGLPDKLMVASFTTWPELRNTTAIRLMIQMSAMAVRIGEEMHINEQNTRKPTSEFNRHFKVNDRITQNFIPVPLVFGRLLP
ncbi:hypothetical protein M3Y96_01240300 [Aphelenchoides besseyi]|nr:hypothetical protein M3Y96_01240300 [Aphelenchoides besseyi]